MNDETLEGIFEYQRDLDAYKELYSELCDRYSRIHLKLEGVIKFTDNTFEKSYEYENCPIRKFIENVSFDIVRISYKIMSFGIKELVKMERDLNALENELLRNDLEETR